MARKKQQKKRLKKYKGKYVTADRLDMSKGGRVGFAPGGKTGFPGEKEFIIDITDGGGPGGDIGGDTGGGTGGGTSETGTQSQMNLGDTTAGVERTERIAQTAEQIQAGAVGVMPSAAKIPGVSEEEGTAVTEDIAQRTTPMVKRFGEDARVTTAQDVAPETVTEGEVVKEGVVDKQVTAATFNAIVKNQPANVQAAIQEFTPELKARITANVQDAAMESPTKAAEIAQQQIAAALTPEVVGSLRDVSEVPYIQPKE